MTSAHTGTFAPTGRRCGTVLTRVGRSGLVLAAAWAAAMLLALPWPAQAAEFITPPGLNVPAQERELKERVTALAQDLVGDKLVDVLVHIGYVRAQPGSASQIKLPGFNHFISPSNSDAKSEGSAIVAGHTRIRQVVVMVSDQLDSKPEAIAEELRAMGRFDPAQGDLLRVVLVADPKAGTKADPANAEEAAAERRSEERKAAAKRRTEQPSQTSRADRTLQRDEADLAEAESTLSLLKARRAYFRGDYDQALDQILQALSRSPNNPQAFSMLGSLYYSIGWKNLALKYWEKSLTLDPDNQELLELVVRMRSRPAAQSPTARQPGSMPPRLDPAASPAGATAPQLDTAASQAGPTAPRQDPAASQAGPTAPQLDTAAPQPGQPAPQPSQ